MNNIWKFALWSDALSGRDEIALSMPKGSKILAVGDQNGIPTIWAQVMAVMPHEERLFRVYGTGQPILDPEHLTYLGSAIGHSPVHPFVWHVYEVDA